MLEPAKGVLSRQGRLDMDQAYGALVRYSRDFDIKIVLVARAGVERALPPTVGQARRAPLR